MEIYSYKNGIVTTEQDLVTEIDSFLTSDIGGWTRHVTVSDTASNRDYVFTSAGETGDYDQIYIRFRAEANYLYFYGYITFVDVGDNSGEIYDASYTRFPTGATPFRYWLVGNKDFIQVHIMQAYYYMGYAGLIRSYYITETDNYPLLIRGMSGSSTTWNSSNTSYMHNPTTSGEQAYKIYSAWDTYAVKYDIGLRSPEVLMLPLVAYSATVSQYEVRGEPYGVFQSNATYTAHGASMTTVSGSFLSFLIGTDAFIYGPVSSGTCDLY
jgi:hypothetical protein